MKTSELMLSDYLFYKGEMCRIKVASITKKKVGYHIKDNENRMHYARLCDCEPILVTTEILEKNDFIDNNRVLPYPYYEYINEKSNLKIGFAFPQGNRTSYKEPWVYIDSKSVFVEHLPCVFVHQLQHALRLCGIEKEIIL